MKIEIFSEEDIKLLAKPVEIGDAVFWFESACSGHWTVAFSADGLYLRSGIVSMVDGKGGCQVPGCPDNYPLNIDRLYGSKQEALDHLRSQIKILEIL